ncbi:MAG: hypothetical protein H6R12_2590, partial [Proteobacteria bacterium]|nr:hypothetical protein [Pseudomonadota bacterium]
SRLVAADTGRMEANAAFLPEWT